MVVAPGVIRRHALGVIRRAAGVEASRRCPRRCDRLAAGAGLQSLVEDLTAARRARIAAVDAAEQQQSD
jgi:hypothetical protein